MVVTIQNLDFKFEAPVGTRVLSRKGVWICAWPTDGSSRWWLPRSKVWIPDYLEDERWKTEGASSTAPCHSFKAFKRHIRKHQSMLTGCLVTLQHRYIGHNISIQL